MSQTSMRFKNVSDINDHCMSTLFDCVENKGRKTEKKFGSLYINFMSNTRNLASGTIGQ